MTPPITKQTKRRDVAMAALFGRRPLRRKAKDNLASRIEDALVTGRGITARRLTAICAQAVIDNGQAEWSKPKVKFVGFVKYFEQKRLTRAEESKSIFTKNRSKRLPRE